MSTRCCSPRAKSAVRSVSTNESATTIIKMRADSCELSPSETTLKGHSEGRVGFEGRGYVTIHVTRDKGHHFSRFFSLPFLREIGRGECIRTTDLTVPNPRFGTHVSFFL